MFFVNFFTYNEIECLVVIKQVVIIHDKYPVKTVIRQLVADLQHFLNGHCHIAKGQ
jgi:hypothetical protein